MSGLAVIGGRVLLRYMKLSVLHYIAAGVCLIFAGVGVYQLITGYPAGRARLLVTRDLPCCTRSGSTRR